MDNKRNKWLRLCQRLMRVNLSVHPDQFVWKLTTTGKFTVKSLYLQLMNDNTTYLHKYLWKFKVPLKVIHMAVHWIQLWSHLLPADQQEPMVTGCNQLLTVA
uniref:Reverse transcriptase zinc-binding domain-containing protein n=1 Tax=Setaria italica TaxID=4555 RepID=K3Z068_SETIT